MGQWWVSSGLLAAQWWEVVGHWWSSDALVVFQWWPSDGAVVP